MNASTLLRSRGPRRALLWLLLAATVLTVAPALLASPEIGDGEVQAAHQALAEGQYAAAESDYEAILRARGFSAPLLYNLGNAYLRDGKPTRALLAYERANLLAPRDEAIATNLAAARSSLGVVDDRAPMDRFAGSLTMNAWAWAASGAFWLTLVAAGASLLWKRGRTPTLTAAALAATVGVVSGGGLLVASRSLHRGLVMAAAPALVSPFESAQSGFSLAPGETVDLGHSRGEYIFVRDAHGRSGWVEQAEVAPLIPIS